MHRCATAVLLGVAIGALSVTGSGSAQADSGGGGVHVKKYHETLHVEKTVTPVPLASAPVPAPLCEATLTNNQSISQTSGGTESPNTNNGGNAAADTLTQGCTIVINNTFSGESPTATATSFTRERTAFQLDKK
ncbi:hypothetical protein [Streptomyces anandii]|uniref:hypothetical protein n=1 Tax=Streptomyces anandii TaxID=285454 RepID=UPI000AD9FAAA|nr:hypothetical protein [Streptomyces anandii]GGY02870.1 hypothetical protein GCM10010510_56290 [Streptomyces anandii JCM 4720]